MNRTMITGHSGFENTGAGTLNSVAAAIRMNLDCVEVDARLDPEGTPRLSHDDFTNYKEAALLKDALDLIAQSEIRINVDLKTPETLYPALTLAEECGLKPGQLIFSGSVEGTLLDADDSIARRAQVFWNTCEILKYCFRLESTLKDHRVSPGQVSFDGIEDDLFNEYMDHIVKTAKAKNVAAINLSYRTIKPETIGKLIAQGVPVSVWTVNDREWIQRNLDLGALNITSMNPTAAQNVRDEQRR